MTRKIQAYFRTENEAEGAKIALISYKVDGLEVWPLTDPIGEDRRILFPIAPFSNTTLAAGTVGTLGTGSTPAAGAMLALVLPPPKRVMNLRPIIAWMKTSLVRM